MGVYAILASVPSHVQEISETPTKLTGLGDSLSLDYGAVAEVDHQRIRNTIAGDYLVYVSLSASADVEDNYTLELYRNGDQTGFKNSRKIGNLTSLGLHGIVTLNRGDRLELFVSKVTGTGSITVESSQFIMIGI